MGEIHEGPDLPTAPFTLRQVECFVAIAEADSISRAATRLHASDSAVADALTSMERALGTTLFNRRRSRGVTLTSDGLAILQIARRMLADAEELAAAVGRDARSVVGPVRVAAVSTLAPVIIPRLTVAMGKQYPGVRVDFRTGDQPELLTAMANAELDCLVTFDIDVPPELRRRTLLTTRACVVLPVGHRLAESSAITLEELAEEPMVLLDIESSRIHTLELMSSRGITPRIALRSANYELCRSLVGAGLGYTLLMYREIATRTWDGSEVRFIPIHPAPRAVDILVTWRSPSISPRLEALIRTAVEVCRDLPGGPSTGDSD
ncbi:MAG: LysR family transcriptional regulator [Propionibacteriaceae bacterium]